MALCVSHYMDRRRRYRVLDLGARISPNQQLTHRQLLEDYDVKYTGVDVRDGRNVDKVMRRPYRIPAKSGSIDVVFSGQTFEHIAFPWASMLEIARILAPGGLAFITAPSRGHEHGMPDCWRYYPDGLRALGAWSGLETLEAYTDFPPVVQGVNRPRPRYDYARIDRDHYWGDSVGVFRKPMGREPRSTRIIRTAVRWWANRVGGVPDAPAGAPVPGRDAVLDARS
jgi:SAM-dependent methyltransferase